MRDFAATERRAWLGLWQIRPKPMATWATDVHAGHAPDIQLEHAMHIRRVDGLPCIHIPEFSQPGAGAARLNRDSSK